jgi:dihydrofolate synthase/folylpolyglutamate synthase
LHAFTKPHLFQLNERFVVSSEIASDELLIGAAEDVSRVGPGLTQFDAQVAAALTLFHENAARLTLIETGMGGSDDSTNIIPTPAASVITPIGLDHQDMLGATLAEIAAHKAGILKPGVPAVSARQASEAMAVVKARAEEVGAPLFRAGVEWDAYASHGRLVVQTEACVLDLPLPALQGRHQIDNAGLACAALLLSGIGGVAESAFAAGIESAIWPGRLQPLTRGPLSAPVRAIGGEVWIDGGHNAQAATALARALGDMKVRRGGLNVAIVGMRSRKDADSFIRALAGVVERIVAVPLPAPHVAPSMLATYGNAIGVETVTAASLGAAMHNAAQAQAARVLICGSLLLAAEALALENA